jgi:acetyl esterase/lipase
VKAFARLLGLMSLLTGGFAVRAVNTYQGFMVKTTATSQTPALTVIGALAAALGLRYRSMLALLGGAVGAGIGAAYTRLNTAPHDKFERAFGQDWQSSIPKDAEERMLQRRLSLRLPETPEPIWSRDLPFWTIPGTDRQLLADIWEPPAGVERTGTAIVYLYGGSWHFFDKDVLTRPFFRQLAAQGHVVMDAAHRSCPEVDITGMVADVHRAVAWMKANADRYGIDPDRVVTMGGSSGAHIALLAAYAPDHPRLKPDELRDTDTTVRAVVSYYGIPDMQSVYHRAKVQAAATPSWAMPATEKAEPTPIANAFNRWFMGRTLTAAQSPPAAPFPQLYIDLLGGLPDEVPEMYDLGSPISHVHAGCPLTLIFQGTHDVVVSLDAARRLAQALRSAGVPVVYVEFPWTEHAFDLMYPPLANPAAKAALYDLERFLAYVAHSRESDRPVSSETPHTPI